MKRMLFFVAILAGLCGCSQKHNGGTEGIRKASIIMVKPEKLALYKELHAKPWPSVNQKLKECNVRNYSIFYRDGYLFSYMEYTGADWKGDMEKLAADSTIQAWWKLTDPCQEPVPFAREGEWWADMEEVYHLK